MKIVQQIRVLIESQFVQKVLFRSMLWILFLPAISQAAVVYVDSIRGNNSFDGSTNAVISSSQGPKISISAAITAAPNGSTIVVASGYYQELLWNSSITWDLNAKSLTLMPYGTIQIVDNYSTAGDGIPDWWRQQQGLTLTNALANMISTNSWAHGLTYGQLFQNLSVLFSNNYSTLNDGLPDWWKAKNGFSLTDTNISQTFNGLIGWWKLEEGAGTNVVDSSPNGLNGTLMGNPLPIWTNGVSDYAIKFNSTNYVQISNSPSFIEYRILE